MSIIRPDSKGRINLGSISENASSYKVTVEENGKIILEPYMEISLTDKWIYENKELLEKMKTQLQKEGAL